MSLVTCHWYLVLSGGFRQEPVEFRLQGGDGDAELLKLREALVELDVFHRSDPCLTVPPAYDTVYVVRNA